MTTTPTIENIDAIFDEITEAHRDNPITEGPAVGHFARRELAGIPLSQHNIASIRLGLELGALIVQEAVTRSYKAAEAAAEEVQQDAETDNTVRLDIELAHVDGLKLAAHGITHLAGLAIGDLLMTLSVEQMLANEFESITALV